MTIMMTEKHQITIPKKIAEVLGLHRGSMFDVEVHRNRIELIPVETTKKAFTKDQYKKLEALSKAEQGLERRVARDYIEELKKGRG